MPAQPDRVTVVIATRNRRPELLRTLGRLRDLPERPPVIVVDNASADDSPAAVRDRFPAVTLRVLPRNAGAAARNVGVALAATPYVAFSDDDKARISAAVTLTACERARLRGSSDEWLNPTLLGAAFDAGDVEKAQDVANQVVIDGHSVWKLDTILEDCRTSAKLYEDSCRGELLEVVDQLQALLGPKPML